MASGMEKIAGIKQERRKIGTLNPAVYNPRKALKPGDAEYESLKTSIETFGYVDPIIVNSDGTVIGGHQRLAVLVDLGYTEVDVAVVNLNKNDEKALNIALNKISGEWDNEKLAAIFTELKMDEYDVTLTGFGNKEISDILSGLVTEEQEVEEQYSSNVTAPIYEPTGDMPEVSELFDRTKAMELLADIDKEQNITDEEREFLRLAAMRHIVFDFRNIAEYYANASAEMQKLMEDSALVIIDFGKAIEKGFCKLQKSIEEVHESEDEE